MSKSILKKVLLLGAVGGLVALGFQAQKYVRMFIALRGYDQDEEDEEEQQERESEIDEMLRTGEAVKVRISSAPEDDSEDEQQS